MAVRMTKNQMMGSTIIQRQLRKASLRPSGKTHSRLAVALRMSSAGQRSALLRVTMGWRARQRMTTQPAMLRSSTISCRGMPALAVSATGMR